MLQGLPGRLCGHNRVFKGEMPIIYCNIEPLYEFIKLMLGYYNYSMNDFTWKSVNLRTTTLGLRIQPCYISKLEEDTSDNE